MAIAWYGGAVSEEVLNPGPLNLIHPVLQRLDICGIIDRHLPPDPQLEFSHGQVLSLLLAASFVPADRSDERVGLGRDDRGRITLGHSRR